ncbi:MAG: hypothetical protein AB1423_14520 [Pseudomonadota bacterium]
MKNNIAYQMKRVVFDLSVLAIFLVLLFFLMAGTEGAIQLILLKGLLVSAGVIHAHIIRKLMFPYIDFNKSKDVMQKAMVIVIYAVVIFAWSRGG